MRFSEYFKLGRYSQKDFDFVDILINTDTRLFLDPLRLDTEKNDKVYGGLYQNCIQKLDDFFDTILTFYNNGEITQARTRFDSSHEINHTHIGYSNGESQGNGNTKELLTKVFNEIIGKQLIDNNVINKIYDMNVFVKDFAEDHFSDLIVSIILKELAEFTKQQALKHSISLQPSKSIGQYWDVDTHDWKDLIIETIEDGVGNPIILLPKKVVVREYMYDPEKYLSDHVLVWRQNYHQQNNTELSKQAPKNDGRPTKKQIRENEIVDAGKTTKEYLIDMTIINPQMIRNFYTGIQNALQGTNSNKLSDEELTEIIDLRAEEIKLK